MELEKVSSSIPSSSIVCPSAVEQDAELLMASDTVWTDGKIALLTKSIYQLQITTDSDDARGFCSRVSPAQMEGDNSCKDTADKRNEWRIDQISQPHKSH